jgi:outer membrane protein assembly factor BamB
MKAIFLLLAIIATLHSESVKAAPPAPEEITTATTMVTSDWPRWRGANFNDISISKALKDWPAEGPEKLWLNQDAGLGYSGYAIVGDTLYTMGARDVVEYVIAIDVSTGKEKWSSEVGALLTNGWGNGPRSTPSVNAGKIYAMSGKGSLVCLDAATGKQVWRKSMEELGGKVPGWGYTESPLVDGNMVVCTPGGGQGTMAAFDKNTGEKVWQSTEWTDPAQYASILPVTHNGARQLIQLTMQSIAGVNAADGKVLWKSAFPGKTAVIPTPIFSEGQVFVAAGYGVGCQALKIGEGNTVTSLFSNTDMVNHHGGVVLHNGNLFGYSDKGGWTCMDFKTGAVKWAEKEKLKKGAIHCCNDQLYLLEEDSGTVVLIDAAADGWHEHGRFKLDPQTAQRSPKGKVWTHPVVANGRLFLRDQELLFCFDVAAK